MSWRVMHWYHKDLPIGYGTRRSRKRLRQAHRLLAMHRHQPHRRMSRAEQAMWELGYWLERSFPQFLPPPASPLLTIVPELVDIQPATTL